LSTLVVLGARVSLRGRAMAEYDDRFECPASRAGWHHRTGGRLSAL